MRKMLNKKGFSLVELMIVVVIMGILIAVAIPLYGAITDNANNKTCANNIKAIKNNAANYKATWNANAGLADLKATFDGKDLPKCPLEDGKASPAPYTIAMDATGAVEVKCPNGVADNDTSANKFHKHTKIGSKATFSDGYTELTAGK